MSLCNLGLSNGFSARENIGAEPHSTGTWKPGYQAFAVIQCPQGMHAALEPDVQMQIPLAGHVLLQHRQRDVVAGANREQQRALVPGIGEHAGEVRAQCLYMRLHAGARPPLRPQQPFGKPRRSRPLALRPADQRLAEEPLPLSQRAPDVAVGECRDSRRPAGWSPPPRPRASSSKSGLPSAAPCCSPGVEGIAQMYDRRAMACIARAAGRASGRTAVTSLR